MHLGLREKYIFSYFENFRKVYFLSLKDFEGDMGAAVNRIRLQSPHGTWTALSASQKLMYVCAFPFFALSMC